MNKIYKILLIMFSAVSLATSLSAQSSYCAAPTVTTLSATNVTATSATLRATVNPNGLLTAYLFQFGETTSYDEYSSGGSIEAGSFSSQTVYITVTGLTPSTTYHYRAKAGNMSGMQYGADKTFTTLPEAGPPTATTYAATGITENQATLRGFVEPNGSNTAWRFEYGVTSNYGEETSAAMAYASGGSKTVASTLVNLTPGTTYHYRLVTANSNGYDYGSDRTFTTLGSANLPPTMPVNPFPANGAVNMPTNPSLTWSCYDPEGGGVGFDLYYGTSPSNMLNHVSGTGTSAVITDLTNNQTYYWKVIVYDSENSSTQGPVWSFTTEQLGCSWLDCNSSSCGDGMIFSSSEIHEAVSYLCAHNIIDDGNNGNLLRPDDPISRAELSKLALLALYDGYPNTPEFFPSDFYPSVYIDLQDSTAFYYRFAKALLYLQYNDDTTPFDRNRACFDPAGEVSRNMILKVLLQTYDISPSSPSGSNPFTDFNPDQPGWGYGKRAYDLGITTETEFRPYSVCTRAEAFMFLYRILINPNISIPVPTSSDWYVPNNLSPETLDALKSIEKGSFEYYEKSCLHVEGYIPLDFAIMYESYLTDLPSDLSPLTPIGRNGAWTHSYNSYINVIENPYTHDEYLILHLGTDGIYMYKKAANSASIERLTDGDYNVLEPDGANAYSLTTPDQMVYIFTKLNEKAIFYLTALKNRFNDQISLSYSNAVKPGFKRLNSVSDGVSTLNFTYKPGTDFVASVTDPIRTVSFDYNADSVLMSYTNAKGGVTMFSHGTLPENENLLLSITLPKGNVISNEYSNRLLIASTQVGTASSYTSNVIPNVAISHDINYATGSYTSNVTTGGITTHYVMNSKGRTIHRYGGGVDETYTYSQQHPTLPAQITNNLTSESYLYTYNTSGLTTSETHTGGGLTAQKTWTYNSMNDVTSYADPDGNTCQYSYTNGALTRVISAGGDTTIYVNDSHGLPVRVTANGVVTDYTHNNMGLVTSISIPAENLSKSFSCDEVSRLTEAVDYAGLSKIWAYDPNDNVISETTPAGVTLMSWDANDNLISVTDALGKTTTIAYNDVDLATSQSFGGFTSEWSWHPDGLLQSVTRPDGQVLSYNYNSDRQLTNDGYASYDYTAGRCSSVTKDAKAIQIAYDGLGRVSSTSYDDQTVSYVRTLSGLISGIIYPGNKTVNYQRRGDGLVTGVTDWMGRTTSFEYNHGKISKIQLPNGVETEISYDAAGRQTGQHTKRDDNSVICSYTFSLDPNGNHTSETVVPYIAFPHPEAGMTNYSYNFNRITTSVGSVGSVYQHDANGNVILAGNTAMTYDLRNHLTSVVNDSTNSVFEYDGYGNRRIATRNGVIMKYVLDLENNANVLMETDVAGNVLNYYVYADDLLLYRIGSNGFVHYYVYDFRGSTVALVDADGEVTNRYAYDEYGKVVYQQDSTDSNPFLFCGAYGGMSEGDFYYMRARFYDPSTGRFLTEDPEFWDVNLYDYCSGNPINGIDPDGLRKKDPFCSFKADMLIFNEEVRKKAIPTMIVGGVIGGAAGGTLLAGFGPGGIVVGGVAGAYAGITIAGTAGLIWSAIAARNRALYSPNPCK